MKFSLSDLKSMDWKQFGVNHGEKVALGFVSVLTILIVWKLTLWSEYDKHMPEDLQNKVVAESQNLESSTWPDEEARAHPISFDIGVVHSGRQEKKIAVERYAYQLKQPFIWKLHRERQKYEEPKWVTVQQVVATGGRFVLETLPPGVSTKPLTIADAAAADPADLDNLTLEERRRQQIIAEIGGKVGGGRSEGSGYEGGGGFEVDPSYGTELSDVGMYNGEEGAEQGPVVYSRGVRYMCVRGVYPFRDQLKKIAEARHDMSQILSLSQVFTPVDFKVQRQKLLPGQPVPSEKNDKGWEDVNLELARKVLQESADWEQDIYGVRDIDQVITMPLPYYLGGNWLPSLVGHKALTELTAAVREQQRLFSETAVEQNVELQSNQVQLGGFAPIQAPIRQIVDGVMGSGEMREAAFQDYETQYTEQFGAEGNVTNALQDFKAQLATTTEHLLFRFFDFDVEPGATYCYRVRLEVLNPNFGLDIEEVANPELVKNKTVWTDWSQVVWEDEASKRKGVAMGTVPADVEYFVESAEPDRSGAPEVEMKVFQWMPELGTIVTDILNLKPGQMVGGLQEEVDVIRPGMSFETEDVVFHSDAVVVDIDTKPMRSDSSDFHSDLEIPKTEGGRLTPVEQTLVVDEFGELQVIDPYTHITAHIDIKIFAEEEAKANESLKQVAGADGSEEGLDMFIEGDEAGYMQMGEAGPAKGSRRGQKQRQNPLRGISQGP